MQFETLQTIVTMKKSNKLLRLISKCNIITVILIIYSCTTEQNSTIDTYSISSEDCESVIKIKGIDKETYKKGIPYSELFSDVKYVLLSSSPNSAIGNITKMEITEEGDYIIFDEINGSIFRFDPSGKFLNDIGCKGHGKGEYICPCGMQYDSYSKQIAVSDRGRKQIMFYDLEGKYLNSLKFDYYFSEFGIINKDYIVVFLNHEDRPEKGQMAYNFKVYDRSGKLVRKYEPYGNDLCKFWPTDDYTFARQNGQLIVNEFFTSPILTFESDTMRALYYLDFGEWQVPSEKLKGKIYNPEFFNWFKEQDYVHCKNFYETKSAYILQLLYKDQYLMIYLQDKNDPSKYLTGSIGSNDIYGIASINNFQYIHDNKMYMVFDPSYLEFDIDLINRKRDLMVRRHKQITEKEIALLKQMSKNPNPIIQICTLK